MCEMTVGQLAEYLAELDPETPVRFAGQPNYPLEYGVGDQIAVVETADGGSVVYLAESHRLGYLPSAASAALGW